MRARWWINKWGPWDKGRERKWIIKCRKMVVEPHDAHFIYLLAFFNHFAKLTLSVKLLFAAASSKQQSFAACSKKQQSFAVCSKKQQSFAACSSEQQSFALYSSKQQSSVICSSKQQSFAICSKVNESQLSLARWFKLICKMWLSLILLLLSLISELLRRYKCKMTHFIKMIPKNVGRRLGTVLYCACQVDCGAFVL